MAKRSSIKHDLYAVTILLLCSTHSHGIQSEESRVCSLKCPDGIPCVIGSQNTSLTSSASDKGWKGMHCACPPGTSGLLCQSKTENCNNTDSKKCLNNGSCEVGAIDYLGNPQYSCNCESTIDATSGIGYEGEYCELAYTINKTAECSLPCLNGNCVIGPRSNTSLPPFWENYFDGNGDGTNDLQFMHCECNNGFDGALCEIEKSPCGSGDYCYYGSQCVSRVVNNAAVRECDCSAANTLQVSFAGQYCQYKVSQFCLKNEGSTSGSLFCVNGGTCRSNVYEGCDCPVGFSGTSCEIASEDSNITSGENANPLYDVCTIDANPVQGLPLSFCVNGGKCKAQVSQGQMHPGCICEQGFVGPHCELRDSARNYASRTTDSEYVDSKHSTILISIVVVGLIVGFTCLLGLFIYRHRRTKFYSSNISYINWAKKYQDRQESIDETNIAPRRDSAFAVEQGNRLIDANSFTSSRDPMITRLVSPSFLKSFKKKPAGSHLEPFRQGYVENDEYYIEQFQNDKDGILKCSKQSPEKRKELQHYDSDFSDNRAQTINTTREGEILIVLGPPKDEDGHILHSVEIL